MKTASMVLGIVGGAIAIIVGLLCVFYVTAFFSSLFESFNFTDADFNFGGFSRLYITIYTVMGILSAAGGVLGLIGGIIVKKHSVAAGVMMIVGAVISVSFILFILGGIFALIKEKQQAQPYPQAQPEPQV